MKILAIETSCDETAAAVTEGRRILSNAVFSQINIHKKYGGVYPTLAKRAHVEKIEPIVEKALKDAGLKIDQVNAIAVTFGPGLVIALEIGLNKAKGLALKFQKPLIPVDHIEGHIYSVFSQNRNGLPKRDFNFPFLALIVSGGTTSLIIVEDHLKYQVLGKTLDDAAGEALDKAAKMMGLGYPGGPIIEELSKRGSADFLSLPIPMKQRKDFNFSYSGLKTAFKRELEKLPPARINKNLANLAASFQKTVFDSIIDRLESALEETGIKTLAVGGGVIANADLRKKIRAVGQKRGVSVYFPFQKKLFNDNAAMVGVAAYFKYQNGVYLTGNFDKLDRVGRPELGMWSKRELVVSS